MARTYQYGEEESAERCKEGDAVGVFPKHLLSNLNQPVHASGCLHDARAGNGSDDDVNHVCWRRTGFQMETENQQCQSDAGNGSQGKASVS